MIARKPWQIFTAVQKALFLRELGMRFTSSKAGLFWTFFEPFFQIIFFVLIKVVIFGRSNENFDYVVFLALNFTAYNLFKNIVTKSMGSFIANKGLFIYKQVKPIDTIIARAAVEIFITGIIIVILTTIGFYFNFDMNIKNLPLVALGFVWIVFFALALGIFLAVGNTFYDNVGKIVGIIMSFLMFGSAIFYTIQMLPSDAQKLLLLNPLTHFMEMIHGHYFTVLNDSFVDYNYMLLWTLAPMFAGLWFYTKLEKRIVSL